jgi:predicted enzyme related to lactoylglutathione lyase
MTVIETFFSVDVSDMRRATAFYVEALGASVIFASSDWSSLRIAGVRLGLGLHPAPAASKIGLHFAVSDLAAGCAAVQGAGGRIVAAAIEAAPGVFIAEVTDTEGNTFSLSQA